MQLLLRDRGSTLLPLLYGGAATAWISVNFGFCELVSMNCSLQCRRRRPCRSITVNSTNAATAPPTRRQGKWVTRRQ